MQWSGGGPTGGAWNGVGATFSTDGVHFADLGQVIQKDAKAVWLGSGSVLKTASGEYVPIYYYYYLEFCLILIYL